MFVTTAVCQSDRPLSWSLLFSWLILFGLLLWLHGRLRTPPHEEAILWDGWNFFGAYGRRNQLFLLFLFSTFSLWPEREASQLRIKDTRFCLHRRRWKCDDETDTFSFPSSSVSFWAFSPSFSSSWIPSPIRNRRIARSSRSRWSCCWSWTRLALSFSRLSLLKTFRSMLEDQICFCSDDSSKRLKWILNSHKQTFRFGYELSTAHYFNVSIRSAIRIRFLVLHGLNNLLARNHMTENHMDSEKIQLCCWVLAMKP